MGKEIHSCLVTAYKLEAFIQTMQGSKTEAPEVHVAH